MKKKVICTMCKKKVLVDLIPYGGGYVWVCPECNKLAYNGKKEVNHGIQISRD